VTDALTLPPGSTISGQPVFLVSVVATVPQRQRQIDAVHAYWRLAEAAGEFRVSYERQQRLARLRAGNGEAAELRTAQAVAAAQVREAELQVITAQHDLAEILLLAAGTPLPLPADQPLVGPYRTRFAELFAGKMAPERARMLDQTLPLRASAVESHAAALTAAEDALDAAVELQTGGQRPLADVIAALDGQVRQQRAFLAAVCRYNHDIADYALVVVPPQTTPAVLVSTLIKQNRPAGQPVVPLPTTAALGSVGILPASGSVGNLPESGISPSAASGSPGIIPPIPNSPTRAAQTGVMANQNQEIVTPTGAEETAPANSPGSVGILPASRAVVAPPNRQQGNEAEEPRLAPPQETAIPIEEQGAEGREQGAKSREHGAKSREQGTQSGKRGERTIPPPSDTQPPGGSTTRTSQKPISDPPAPGSSLPAPRSLLLGLPPAERAVKLTAILYEERNVPAAAGQPVPLIDCLRTITANNRVNVVDAYWAVRQAGAQHEVLLEEIQGLESLRTMLAAQNPPSPTAMLNLRAARLAVEAQRADTEADWTMARHQLAGLVEGKEQGAATMNSPRPPAGAGILPQPVSIPFVGRLPLPASSSVGILPASSSGRSWSQRRLEATIPQREQTILDQAAVVVEADALRAAATADFLAGRASCERVLAGIELEARETTAFLQGVSEYNRAICRYAASTLPANTQVEKFAAALEGQRAGGAPAQRVGEQGARDMQSAPH
jgi:hypothetical protein